MIIIQRIVFISYKFLIIIKIIEQFNDLMFEEIE